MTDIRQLLDEIEREQEMWEAFIAGVDTGIDVLGEDVDTTTQEAFRDDLRERFRAFMEDHD